MELANGRVVLHAGDCLEVLASLPENSIDAVVTDPPYHFASMVKRFGKPGQAPINNYDEKIGRNGPYQTASRGFMGKEWDGGDIAFRPETWALVWRVLKPGGHMVAFGAPKNYHRLACAIEDAGFEIRDSLMWVFGTGFPKSMDVSKAIDKAAGAEREKVAIGNPVKRMIPGADQDANGSWIKDNGREYQPGYEIPATDAAREWQGWGTALKPAWESIILCQKPLQTNDELNIIGSKITELELKLWSMLPANVAEQCFGLSQQDFDAVCASAQWSAEERSNTQADLSDLMGMSQFVSALISSLNTVSLWKATLAGSSTQESMSIIETELKTITDWRTLKSLISQIKIGRAHV